MQPFTKDLTSCCFDLKMLIGIRPPLLALLLYVSGLMLCCIVFEKAEPSPTVLQRLFSLLRLIRMLFFTEGRSLTTVLLLKCTSAAV